MVEKARMVFQMRTKMLDFKANYKNDKKYKEESGSVRHVVGKWRLKHMCFSATVL